MKNSTYEKQNRAMRSEYKSETGKTLGKRLTKGKPTKKAIALKKWGFGSVAAAKSFCNANKEKK